MNGINRYVLAFLGLLLSATVLGGSLGLYTPAFSGQGAAHDNRLSFIGFGPIQVGQTVEQATRRLGSLLLPLPNATKRLDPECAYVWPKGNAKAPVAVMVRHNKVVRLDVRQNTVQTVSGIRLGMAESEVRARYKPLTVEPHKYVQGGHTLIYRSTNPIYAPYAMVFETDGHKVTAIRSGLQEEAGWVEGCS